MILSDLYLRRLTEKSGRYSRNLQKYLMKNRKTCLFAGRKNRNRIASIQGFTLVEVMMASVIILMVLMGGFGALIQGSRLIEVSRDETRVSQVLQSEIEELRSYDWATLVALNAESTYSPNSSFTDSYSTRFSVKRKIATRSSLQKCVTMQVSWTDNRGTSHMREYITLISKDGLYDFYYRTI